MHRTSSSDIGNEYAVIAALALSEPAFGGAARDRYAAALLRAMRDLADDPFGAKSVAH